VDKDKIKLHAIHRKDGSITICDQDGREFDAQENSPSADRRYRIWESLELVAPQWIGDIPRANITISVPLEVEERLPEWMIEYLSDRVG
jgi:hypothetical protein